MSGEHRWSRGEGGEGGVGRQRKGDSMVLVKSRSKTNNIGMHANEHWPYTYKLITMYCLP